MSDEFYVGYDPQMPPRLASRIRLAAQGLIVCALLVPATLVVTQDRFATAVFEFGQTRVFEGRLVEYPYPALIVGSAGGDAATHWLVGRGKHGAVDFVRGRDGQYVQVSGSLIQRDADAMIEVAPNGIQAAGDTRAMSHEPMRSLGAVVMQGEIVDSKCHLGVMKPGEGPAHRDCAVRCLLGRIPPMFVSHGRTGATRLSLVSADGGPLTGDVGAWAGRPLSIRGELLQRGTQRFLAVSPAGIRLLE